MKLIIYTLILLCAQSLIINASDDRTPHIKNKDTPSVTPEPYFTFEVCTMTPQQKDLINKIAARAQACSETDKQPTPDKNRS